MYRDDVCAVCGEALPPDHFYCREHAATVDDRLHEISELVRRLGDDTSRLARLLTEVADETWDYLAEHEPDDPSWPPRATLQLRTDADDVSVDVDSEPGLVRIEMVVPAHLVLAALTDDFTGDEWQRLAGAAARAQGANATH